MEETIEQVEKAKKALIDKYGALDIHFQIPAHESPKVAIPSLVFELMRYCEAMIEFFEEKTLKEEDEQECRKFAATAEMWKFWMQCNNVTGKVITSEDPMHILKYHMWLAKFVKEALDE